MTLPITTVSTSSGRIFARATAAPIAAAPSVGAGTSLRLPPNVPIGVRTGSAKTTERCDVTAGLLPGCVQFDLGVHAPISGACARLSRSSTRHGSLRHRAAYLQCLLSRRASGDERTCRGRREDGGFDPNSPFTPPQKHLYSTPPTTFI